MSDFYLHLVLKESVDSPDELLSNQLTYQDFHKYYPYSVYIIYKEGMWTFIGVCGSSDDLVFSTSSRFPVMKSVKRSYLLNRILSANGLCDDDRTPDGQENQYLGRKFTEQHCHDVS